MRLGRTAGSIIKAGSSKLGDGGVSSRAAFYRTADPSRAASPRLPSRLTLLLRPVDPAEEAVEPDDPGLRAEIELLESLAHASVGGLRPRAAKRDHAVALDVLDLALHFHRAVDELAREVEQRAAGTGPHLAPFAAARQVEGEARARRTARAVVVLVDRAAAVALLDRVRADERAVGLSHFPAADPEVEVARTRPRPRTGRRARGCCGARARSGSSRGTRRTRAPSRRARARAGRCGRTRRARRARRPCGRAARGYARARGRPSPRARSPCAPARASRARRCTCAARAAPARSGAGSGGPRERRRAACGTRRSRLASGAARKRARRGRRPGDAVSSAALRGFGARRGRSRRSRSRLASARSKDAAASTPTASETRTHWRRSGMKDLLSRAWSGVRPRSASALKASAELAPDRRDAVRRTDRNRLRRCRHAETMRELGEVAEWLNAAVLKTVDPQGFGGSNPSLSATI